MMFYVLIEYNSQYIGKYMSLINDIKITLYLNNGLMNQIFQML